MEQCLLQGESGFRQASVYQGCGLESGCCTMFHVTLFETLITSRLSGQLMWKGFGIVKVQKQMNLNVHFHL